MEITALSVVMVFVLICMCVLIGTVKELREELEKRTSETNTILVGTRENLGQLIGTSQEVVSGDLAAVSKRLDVLDTHTDNTRRLIGAFTGKMTDDLETIRLAVNGERQHEEKLHRGYVSLALDRLMIAAERPEPQPEPEPEPEAPRRVKREQLTPEAIENLYDKVKATY